MAEKKEQHPRFIVNSVPVIWAKVDKPWYGTEEFPKKDGSFELEMNFAEGSEELAALKGDLQPLLDEALELAQEAWDAMTPPEAKAMKTKGITGPYLNEVFKEDYDKETFEPTGQIHVKVSMQHRVEVKKGKNKGKVYHNFPKVFDAELNIIPRSVVPEVGNGTTASVQFSVRPYYIKATGAAGIALDLIAVQIIELVERDGGENSAPSGFEKQEGGFKAPAETEVEDDLDGETPTATEDADVIDDSLNGYDQANGEEEDPTQF